MAANDRVTVELQSVTIPGVLRRLADLLETPTSIPNLILQIGEEEFEKFVQQAHRYGNVLECMSAPTT